MRKLIWGLVGISSVAAAVDTAPPPYFAAADGILMTSFATSSPAKLTTGTLGACKRISGFDGAVIDTCDVTGASFVVEKQVVSVAKVQIIAAPRHLDTKKPYTVYWFIGRASQPENVHATLVVTRHEQERRLLGQAKLSDYGSAAAVEMNITD